MSTKSTPKTPYQKAQGQLEKEKLVNRRKINNGKTHQFDVLRGRKIVARIYVDDGETEARRYPR